MLKKRAAFTCFSNNIVDKNKNMELGGIDPPASCMLSRRSTIWATAPCENESDQQRFMEET